MLEIPKFPAAIFQGKNSPTFICLKSKCQYSSNISSTSTDFKTELKTLYSHMLLTIYRGGNVKIKNAREMSVKDISSVLFSPPVISFYVILS